MIERKQNLMAKKTLNVDGMPIPGEVTLKWSFQSLAERC